MNYSPDQASPRFFSATNIPQTLTNSNCMNDLIVWNQSLCGNTPVLQSSSDPQGRCVSITNMTSASVSSTLGNRYGSVFKYTILIINESSARQLQGRYKIWLIIIQETSRSFQL